MEQRFFEQPILNSPYKYPARHWELDENRQPTNRIIERRRGVSFITPIPAARKQRGRQRAFEFDDAASAVGTDDQQYELTRMIESVRHSVDEWRKLPRAKWRVTPEPARLLHHWRHHQFSDIRPFLCQVEAVETVIWLTGGLHRANIVITNYHAFMRRETQDISKGGRALLQGRGLSPTVRQQAIMEIRRVGA